MNDNEELIKSIKEHITAIREWEASLVYSISLERQTKGHENYILSVIRMNELLPGYGEY